MSIGRWWSTLGAQPDPLAGVDVGEGWRFHVEVAYVGTLEGNGVADPYWADVTSAVVDVAWNRGDAASESRLPVGFATVRLKAAHLLTGEPMGNALFTDPNDRFGAGCWLRFGYSRTSDTSWWPQFLGLIDTITEDWSADHPNRPRMFTFDCVEALGYVAAYRNPSTYSSVTNLEFGTAFENLLSATDWPLTRIVDPAVSTTPVMAAQDAQAPLPLLHRLCDSVGASLWCDTWGRLRVTPWGHRLALDGSGEPLVYVFDANVNAGAGYGVYPGPIPVLYPTALRFVSSLDRMLFRANASSTAVAGTASGRSTTPVLTSRYSWRVDRPGWPKTDLLFTAAPPGQPFDPDLVATRSNDPLRCDSATFDTMTAGRGSQMGFGAMISWLLVISELCATYKLQRRAAGLGAIFDRLVTVGGIAGVITCRPHRLLITHELRTV